MLCLERKFYFSHTIVWCFQQMLENAAGFSPCSGRDESKVLNTDKTHTQTRLLSTEHIQIVLVLYPFSNELETRGVVLLAVQ